MDNFQKYSNTIYDFSITSKLRGAWFKMLVDAAKADNSTHEEKLIVCSQFRRLQEYFQCGKCKRHFKIHLERFPPEAVISEPDGLFKWTVKFMSDVNERLGKDKYEYNIIYPMFHIPGYSVCHGDTNNIVYDNPFVNRSGAQVKSSELSNTNITYSNGDSHISRSPHYRV